MNRTRAFFVPVGMVVHETATPNATDEAEQSYFDKHNLRASVHGFVDYDSITQTLPWNERCMGAGPSANRRYIQIELCHFDGARFVDVWKRGVWAFAWVFVNILKIHTINKQNLRSHKEVSEQWHETDHTDPYGFFTDNGRTVDDFRADVQKEINKMLGDGDLKIGTKELPDVKVKLNGVDQKNSVLIKVDGRDTTYIPATMLREAGISVVYEATSGTVLINTK